MKLKIDMDQILMIGNLDNFYNPGVVPFWWSDEDKVKFKLDTTDGFKMQDASEL